MFPRAGNRFARSHSRLAQDGASALSHAWLRPEQFDYRSLHGQQSIVRLLAALEGDIPEQVILEIAGGRDTTSHPALTSYAQQIDRGGQSRMLWRVSFGVPLDLVEYPDSLFTLIAAEGLRVALPRPELYGAVLADAAVLAGAVELDSTAAAPTVRRVTVPRVRRHLVALATGFAVAAGSGSAAGIAAAGTTADTSSSPTPAVVQTTTSSAADPTQAQTDPVQTATSPAPSTSTDSAPAATYTSASQPPTTTTTTSSVTTPAPTTTTTPTATDTTTTTDSAPVAAAVTTDTATTAAAPGAPTVAPTPTAAAQAPTAANNNTATAPHTHKRAGRPGADCLPALVSANLPALRCVPANLVVPTDSSKPHRVLRPHHVSGGAGLHVLPAPAPVAVPAPASSGDNDGDGDGDDVVSTSGSTNGANPFSGMFSDPSIASQLSKYSSLFTNLNEPPKFLIPIYKAAGKRFHVQWQVLAAINSIETDYGRNLSTSSAGALGWMQFMPGTWLEYGVPARGNHTPNPYSPWDAIFTAARYLAANGAPRHLHKAIFAYNHALWYVDAVLWRAQMISDYAFGKHNKDGYALPLDARYMRDLGRTDDGVDIEDAPDGAAVYSMTSGIVTAVASDPGGFGPNYPVIEVTKGPLASQFIYYGHVAASLVHPGQHVVAGQPIAVMGHTGDAASLDHGHIEIGFSDGAGDPLSHHGADAWTPSGDAMRHVLVSLSSAFRIKNT